MGFVRRYIGFQLVPRFRERMAESGGGPPAFVLHRVARAVEGAQPDVEADARQSAQPLHGRDARVLAGSLQRVQGRFSSPHPGQQWETERG